MCKGMYMINKDLRRQNQGFFSQLYYACQLSSGTYYMGVTNSGNLKIQRMHDSTMKVYQNKTLAKGLKKILQELDENTRKSLLCNEPGTPVQEQYVVNFNMKTLEDKLGKALSESFVGKDSLFTIENTPIPLQLQNVTRFPTQFSIGRSTVSGCSIVTTSPYILDRANSVGTFILCKFTSVVTNSFNFIFLPPMIEIYRC